MSRRQSLDRPGILSPPGPFLTPSPSPSISASPRLQPSPSLSPFQQDVLLVAGNTITSATHDQERKTATPGRRQSLHQFTNGSPNAGTVVFQPSPSQSPAAATSVIGVTAGVGGAAIAANTPAAGNEFNTTLVGSNNIQLNKKGNKRITQQQQQQLLQQQQNQLNQQHHQIFSSAVTPTTCHTASSISNTVAGGYGQSHAAAINTSSSFATANVAGCPKGQAKKAAATVLPTSTSLSQQQQQQFQHYHSSSPLIADSPIPSPSNTITAATIKPSTPQPMQMLQQQFTITGNAPHQTNQPQHTQQVFQIIQGPQGQIVAAPAGQQHTLQQRLIGSNATLQTHVTPTSYSSLSSTTTNTTTKSVKPPQQILPKPQQQPYNDASQQQQQQQQQHKSKLGGGNAAAATVHSHTNNMAQMPQISQSPQPQQAQITSGGTGQQQQILLPTGATASLTAQQPLLLNQMPVLVQQNTPQGVQLILRPPTPQLTATPSLVIQNARPQAQLQQQQPQQLLRILGTNGATMQLAAATPTFIVSSQANLIQQTANHIQTIKTNPQNPAITQLTGLHAALSASNQQRSHQPFTTTATINTSHLLGPSVAAQLQNLQLAAAAANGGSITQIQMPNGPSPTTATILSQLPAHFQQSLNNAAAGGSSLINLNQLSGANIQQLAAAAAAAGATFQTPPPPPTSSSANVDMFNAQQNALPSLTHSTSQASQPIRQSTPTLLQSAGITGGTVTINQQQQLSNGQPANTMINASPANSGATNSSLQAQQQQSSAPQTEPKKKAKPRKKKQTAASAAAAAAVQSPAVTTTAPSPTLQVKNVPNTTPSSTANLITNKFSTPVSMSYNTGVMPQLQFSQTSPQNVKLTFTNSNSNTGPSQTNQPPQQQQEQARPKLDLGNVMKLCGIMEDDDDDEDYMDTMSTHGDRATTPASNATQPPQTPTHATSTSTTQAPAPPNANDIMISIPSQNGTDSLPFTVTIPASAALGGATASSNAGHDTTEPHNIFIKIDQNDTASTPYTISIPRLPTAEEIQQQAQQHLAQQAAAAAAAAAAQQQQQHSNNKIGAATMNFTMSSANNLPQLQAMQPTQAQPQPLFNITAGGASLQLPTPISNPAVATTTSATTTTTTTTATVKPRRKPAVRRNGKKQDNSNVVTNAPAVTPSTAAAASITTTTTTTNSVSVMPSLTTAITPAMSSSTGAQVQQQQQQQQQQQGASTTLSHPASTVTTTTPTTASTLAATVAGAPQVPSQIGNIQISQVDTTKMLPNHNSGCGAVENKIQIMPILDSATGAGGGLHIKAATLAPSSQYQSQTNQQQQLQQQHHQQPQNIIFQPPNSQANVQTHDSPAATIKLTADGRHVQLVAIPQTSGSTATAAASSNQTPTVQQQPTNSMASSSGSANNSIMSTPGLTSATILPPQLTGMPSNVSISVGSPATAAALMPQLTGNLTLTVSEQGERLILRHNASQPQDQQSQLLLQALLKGALPNVTIINEPTKLDNSNNSGSNNNIGATSSTQNNRVGLSATTPQLLPPSSLNSTMHHQHAKTLISTNTGAISKLTIPAQVATAVGAKTPTIQLQFNAGPTSLTSSGATANGTTGPTLQLPQQSPQLQMQQQQQQQQQKTFQQTQQQPNMLNPARTPDMAQLIQQQQPHQQQQPMLPQPPSNALLGAASLAAQSQQRYVSLPKINAATQQIFSLNSETNQITPISPTQTAASIGPTERLLIAPAGINAQQLAQCLQLGQIHFNDVNPLPPSTQPQPTLLGMNTTLSANQQAVQQQQQRLQPPQQQIVHPQPIQPLSNVASGVNTNNSTASTNTVTKQIANVAPIIDQSKAKLEPPRNAASTGAVAKKKPVRKPKATTTAADVASGTAGIKNASVVKPMPKLDPLSQKPNNNPVQIVQPNVASGKQVGATAASNNMTTTTGTNSIQPFQTLQQTTKLVGVTAPMQQLVTSGTTAQQQQQQQLQPSSTASMLLQSPSMRSFVSSANIVGCSTTPTNSSNNSLVSTAITSSNGMTLTSSSTVMAPSFSINTEPPSLSALNSSNNTNVLQQQTQMQVQQQQPTQVQLPQQSPQQPQHTVSRVQTIQLTAQQQQMFKQVQMQIQFLTIKLQHKSLLTSLPLPSDFDPTAIAAYTKPMSDAEINVALQRLYTEQQRILAAGKEMPTPEAYLQMPPIGTGAGITLMTQPPQMQQQQQQQVGVGKSNTSVIPANVVQPNNHSSTMTVTATSMSGAASGQQAQTQAGVTHRIHIYPMQHHQTVQQNKQNQQQQQSKLQSVTVSRGKDNNNSNGKGKNITPTQQQATQNSNSNNISTLMPLSQPKQQPMLVPTSKAPALVFQPQQQQQQQQFMLQKPVLVTSSSASSSAMMNGPPPLVFSSPLIAASAAATATSAANTSTATHFATGANGFIQQQQQHVLQQQLHALSQAPTSNLSTLAPSMAPISATTTALTSASHTGTMMTSAAATTTSASHTNNVTCVTTIANATSTTTAAQAHTTTITTTAATGTSIMTTASTTTIDAQANMQLQQSTNSSYALTTTTNAPATAMPAPMLGAHLFRREESLSPQPKLARLSLFLRQLELDQQAALNPDYVNPFQNKEEAVKRLIRYHCLYESVEDLPYEDEERFEQTALQYQEKYHKISNKYQKIIIQESTLEHRTSETCQIQQLMIDDLRAEMEHLRNAEREQALYEQQQQQKEINEPKCESLIATTTQELKHEMKAVKDEPEMEGDKADYNSLGAEQKSFEIKTEPNDIGNNKANATGIEVTMGATAETTTAPTIVDKFDLLKHSTSHNTTPNNAANKQQRVMQTEPQQHQQQSDEKHQYDLLPKKEEKRNWHNAGSGEGGSYANNSHFDAFDSEAAKDKLGASNFYANCNKQLNGTIKREIVPSSVACGYVKKEFENFDIESEITPSFIMKKVEHKEVVAAPAPTPANNAKTQNKHGREKNERSNAHEQQQQPKSIASAPSNNSFAAQYLQHNTKQQQLQQQQQLKQQQTQQQQQQQQQQDDGWLCLQKELSLITAQNKMMMQLQDQQQMNLQQQQQHSTLNNGQTGQLIDLFPNGCINKNNQLSPSSSDSSQHQLQQQQQQQQPNCDQQGVQPASDEPLQNHHQNQGQQQQQQEQQNAHNHMQSSLNEFFDSGDDMADVHKSVETRLEAMFGESPVHLSKNDGSDPHDIEAGLEDIFGDGKSNDDNVDNKSKQQQQQQQQRLWDTELSAANSFMRVTNTQENVLFESEQQQMHLNQQHMQQSMQLNITGNTTRWMQNIDGAFGDFIDNASADCEISRKRRWNAELMAVDADDTLDGAKKICPMSASSSSSGSPISAQQHQSRQHHDSIMEADLLSLHDGIRVEPAAAQMLQMSTQQQGVFCQTQHQAFSNLLDGVGGHHQQHFNNAQQQHSMQQQQSHHPLHSHLQAHMHNNHIGGGDFDDDISRHVQNAIDSILNLQNSESADSLNFSLDHSMGSLLGDSILDDRQQQQASVNCADGVKRRHHLVDELGDCLISGGGSGPAAGDNASNILLDSSQHHHVQQQQLALLNHNHMQGLQQNNHQHHQQQQQQQQHQQPQQHHHQQQETSQQALLANDFSCVAAGLVDEAVKSIMTS